MKISIAATIVILLFATLFGYRRHQQLVSVRESHAQLVATAGQMGIFVDPSHPDAPVRITKRERENKEVDAKAFASEFIAFAREMEAQSKINGEPDEGQQKRIMELMDRMMGLHPAQLRVLIAEIHAAQDLKDETRQGMMGFSIMTLANEQPQAALELFAESADLFKGGGMAEHFISSSLARWAEDDPLAAVEWVLANSGKFPDLIQEDAKRGLLEGAAIQDSRLAFRLIGELGLKESTMAISKIMGTAKTPEQRSATLAALREHLATLPDDAVRTRTRDSAFVQLAWSVMQEDFDKASQWIASSDLSPQETEKIADGVIHSHAQGTTDSARWIDWLGKNLPPDKAADGIKKLVGKWTRNDYQAAGQWLATAPNGAMKNAAIRSYAETVSSYEPETAAQWALTLPPGDERRLTLRRIYQNWPADDTTAKQAFAEKHGIK